VEAGSVAFSASGEGKTRFRASEFAPSSEVIIYHNGKEVSRVESNVDGTATFELALDASYTKIILKSLPQL
jgi:hypothetical protein